MWHSDELCSLLSLPASDLFPHTLDNAHVLALRFPCFQSSQTNFVPPQMPLHHPLTEDWSLSQFTRSTMIVDYVVMFLVIITKCL